MTDLTKYDTHLDIKFAPLSVVDVPAPHGGDRLHHPDG